MSSSIEVTVSTCLYSCVSCGQTETLDRSADPTDCLTLSFSIRKLRNEKKTLMYKLEHKNAHSCCFFTSCLFAAACRGRPDTS